MIKWKKEVIILKPLLSSEELINHMELKGIRFNIDNKEVAKEFLENHNYYLKLASYRANYKKHNVGKNTGKYINLEFAYLRELSNIDRYLRYIIMQMSLDIEHFLKVKLLQSVENNPQEDGYRIIQEFIAQESDLRSLKTIQKHKSSDYCKDLIEKYYPYFPVWVFVELISFGELAHLCDFYQNKYGTEIADRILLNSVRDIRNASAHSNCLINRLSPGLNRPHNSVVEKVKTIATISENTRDKKLSNKILYDFTCLLFAYDDIVSSNETKAKRYLELKNLFENRMIEKKELFKNNNLITSSYTFAKKILDKFEKV